MKTYNIKIDPRATLCPSVKCAVCGELVPVFEPRCLACLAQVEPRSKVSPWKLSMPPVLSTLIIGAAVLGAAVYLLDTFTQIAEARVTISLNNAEYERGTAESRRLLDAAAEGAPAAAPPVEGEAPPAELPAAADPVPLTN